MIMKHCKEILRVLCIVTQPITIFHTLGLCLYQNGSNIFHISSTSVLVKLDLIYHFSKGGSTVRFLEQNNITLSVHSYYIAATLENNIRYLTHNVYVVRFFEVVNNTLVEGNVIAEPSCSRNFPMTKSPIRQRNV